MPESSPEPSSLPGPTNRLAPESETTPAPLTLEQETVAAAEPFVGRWQTLESTTNWEKGRIIAEWRAELEAANAPVTQYSDEAWSTLVGNVTSQHVGRLRRVHARFGDAADQYAGLYWSHFQAAIDWQDAEMWLEGAVQNKWSISQMRAKRWETVGDEQGQRTPGWTEPSSAQGGAYSSGEPSSSGDPSGAATAGEPVGSSSQPATDAPFDADPVGPLDAGDAERDVAALNGPDATPVRPFENLAELPDDLADAFEQFKLAIVTHRLAGWQEASLADVLASLDALKRLASAPVEDRPERGNS